MGKKGSKGREGKRENRRKGEQEKGGEGKGGEKDKYAIKEEMRGRRKKEKYEDTILADEKEIKSAQVC